MVRRKPHPTKQTGEIGSTLIKVEPDGSQLAETISAQLSDRKEHLEKLFGELFISAYNRTLPLGPGTQIIQSNQNESTDDLDFSIKCKVASYLELAELNPMSESFGRLARRTGRYNVYTYARWIYWRIVKNKMRRYGDTSMSTILLLYSTYWQFLPSQKLIDCLNALCGANGCDFAAVFILLTNGTDLRHIEGVHPARRTDRKPGDYKRFDVTNLPPGNHSWSIEIGEIT